MKYIPPKILKEWVKDQPGSEYYSVSVYDDRTVVSSSGRFAHSSGSSSVSWEEFLEGSLNEIVSKTMGKEVLRNVLSFLENLPK